MRTVTVSIINYRTPRLTISCVESVLADFEASFGDRASDQQIVVVDNASGDDSVDLLNDWQNAHPTAPVTVIASPTNTGFSGGHNQAFAVAKGDAVLVLNSDTVLHAGCLRHLMDAMAKGPSVGLCAPRLESEDGDVQVSSFRFPSAMSELIRGAETGPVTRILAKHVVALGTTPNPASIEWASFACILLRRHMIEQLGPMDEGYFLYFEDVEYALRAHRAGWTVSHVPSARAIHFRGGSGPVKERQRDMARLPAYYYASRTRLFFQRGGWTGLFAANISWGIGRAIAQVRRLVGKQVPAAAEREATDIWINALDPLGDRRAPEG